MRRIRIPHHTRAAQLRESPIVRPRHIRILPRFWRFIILLLVLIFGA